MLLLLLRAALAARAFAAGQVSFKAEFDKQSEKPLCADSEPPDDRMCVDQPEPSAQPPPAQSKHAATHEGSAAQPICIDDEGPRENRPPLKQTTLSDFFSKRS